MGERDINRFLKKKGGRTNEQFMRCLVVKYDTIVYIFTAQRTLGNDVVVVVEFPRRHRANQAKRWFMASVV